MNNNINNTTEFFEETPLSIWKDVLGESMDYSSGESILNNRKLFENVTTVLDVGCGWGASARKIKSISPNADITCLSESKMQLEFIGDSFTTIHADANEYKPDRKYEMVTFIQSFTHMNNTAMSNISTATNKLFINDFVSPRSEESYFAEDWFMKIRSIKEWNEVLSTNGFQIKKFEVLPLMEYIEKSKIWLDNINKFNYSGVTYHITLLEELCKSFLDNEKNITGTEHIPPYGRGVFLLDIYAERN